MLYKLTQIIEVAAERWPAKIAFRCGDQAVTYANLLQRANRLACLLREQGLRRGDRVGIYLGKSLESAVAIYGVMQAGAAYVPLDPLLPSARLAAIVRDCGLRHLITQPEKQPRLPFLADTGLECLIGLEADLPVRTRSTNAPSITYLLYLKTGPNQSPSARSGPMRRGWWWMSRTGLCRRGK